MKNLILISTFLVVSFNSFAGVKAIRSATNPATYIDGSGVIQLLTLSNVQRPKNYYDTTGFHVLSGVLIESSSTNYILNSYFSIDTDSNGISDNWVGVSAATNTRETYAFDAIPNSKSQKSTYTLPSEIGRYASIFSSTTANDSFNASGGNINMSLSFLARGNLTTLTTGATSSSNFWVGVIEEDNSGAFQRYPFTPRKLSEAATDGLHATEWHRFCFSGDVTDTDTRRVSVRFGYFGAANGSRPTTGESWVLEIKNVQIEKKTTCTSFIPTTTTAVTRNAETMQCIRGFYQ